MALYREAADYIPLGDDAKHFLENVYRKLSRRLQNNQSNS